MATIFELIIIFISHVEKNFYRTADRYFGCDILVNRVHFRCLVSVPVTRVFLELKKRFWENKGENSSATTDLTIGQVEEQPMIKTGRERERGILEAHVRGLDALQVDKMSGGDRLTFALEQMSKIHPDISDHYEGGISKSWQLDPYSLGAYSSSLPGQTTSSLPEILRPEGRIHFAGEHTPYIPPLWSVQLNQVFVQQRR